MSRAATITDAVDRVAKVAGEHVQHTDTAAEFPVHALQEMRECRLLGLLVPEEHGGLGGQIDDLLEAGIRLGRVDMSVAMVFVMHCQQVAALVRYAADPWRSKILADIADGRVYLGSVTTEAGTGGHLLTAESPLTAGGDELEIDRFAPIVTGGAHADGFLITMRSPHATSERQVSLVYAGRDQLNVEQSGDWQPLGMRASHSVALRLTGTIPAHQVVGEHGDFRTVATEVFAPLAHLGWAACWLGTAAGALSRVLGLLRAPTQRGNTDLRSELLLSRLSVARQRIDGVYAQLRHTAEVYQDTQDVTAPTVQLLLNALKITASEQCYAAVDELVAAVGLRHGYLKNSPTGLERAARDLRSAPLNYSNDRLHLADGRLTLLDPEVHLV